jgi:hypothetical protein
MSATTATVIVVLLFVIAIVAVIAFVRSRSGGPQRTTVKVSALGTSAELTNDATPPTEIPGIKFEGVESGGEMVTREGTNRTIDFKQVKSAGKMTTETGVPDAADTKTLDPKVPPPPQP